MHIFTRRSVPGTDPSSHYDWCSCKVWWSDFRKPINNRGRNLCVSWLELLHCKSHYQILLSVLKKLYIVSSASTDGLTKSI